MYGISTITTPYFALLHYLCTVQFCENSHCSTYSLVTRKRWIWHIISCGWFLWLLIQFLWHDINMMPFNVDVYLKDGIRYWYDSRRFSETDHYSCWTFSAADHHLPLYDLLCYGYICCVFNKIESIKCSMHDNLQIDMKDDNLSLSFPKPYLCVWWNVPNGFQ